MALTLGLRPRLILEALGTASDLGEKIKNSAKDLAVSVAGSYLVIKIPHERRHYWSPQLQVGLDDRDGRVQVNGLITPMPAVWTMFAGIYALILVLGFFGTMYGLAQWQLGHSPFALWSFPLTLLLLGGVYGAALVGQRIGHDQTEELTAFLRGCLE